MGRDRAAGGGVGTRVLLTLFYLAVLAVAVPASAGLAVVAAPEDPELPLPDLAVQMSSTVTSVVAGQVPGSPIYTITVTNVGPFDFTSATVRVTLTATTGGITVPSVTPSTGTVAGDFWTFALAIGETATLTYTLTALASASPGTINGQADLFSSTPGDPFGGNNSASVSTTVTRQVSLSLGQTDSPDPLVAGTGDLVGGNSTYVVSLTNNGPSYASNITVQETLTLPAGVTLRAVSPSTGSWSSPSWQIPALAAGATATLTVRLAADATAADGSVISALAEVTAITEPGTGLGFTAAQSTALLRQVDLRLSVTESVDPVVAGSGAGNLTYLATLENLGPSEASAVAVAQLLALPAGVSLDQQVPTAGTVAGTTWNVGTMASGSTETLTLVLTAAASAQPGTDVISDLLTASAAETLINTGDDSASVATSIQRQGDLSITKTDLVDPVVAGGVLTYVLTVTNGGPSEIAGVLLTDTLPADATFANFSAGPGVICIGTPNPGDPVLCALGVMAPGAVSTVFLTVTVAPNAAGTLTNTAQVAPQDATIDPNSANNSAQAQTAVIGKADLAISQTDNPDPVNSGNFLSYQLTVTNLGPADATGVAVTDTLPTGVAFVSAIPSAGSCGHVAGTVTCELGTLGFGLSAVVDLGVTLNPTTAGTITNVATVGGNQNDPVAGNNTSVETTVVSPPIDLSVTMSDLPDPISVGEVLIYSLTVSNLGANTASGVQLLDNLPPQVTFLNAIPTQGTCVDGAGSLSCFLGNLAPAALASVSLQVTVGPAPSGSISNTATVSGLGTDTNPANNAATESTTVLGRADLALTLQASPQPVAAGAVLTLTVEVSNAGPSAAVDLVMTATLPSGAVLLRPAPPTRKTTEGPLAIFADGFESGTVNLWSSTVGTVIGGGGGGGGGGGCNQSGSTVTCSQASLASGAMATFVLEATLDPATAGGVVSQASVSSVVTDPMLANNSAQAASTVIKRIDLGVEITDAPDPVSPGAGLSYTLTVTNAGPSRATGVSLTSALPPETFNTSASPSQGGCDLGPPVFCSLGALDGEASATVNVGVSVSGAATGALTHHAGVTGNEVDLNPSNDTDTEITTVVTARSATAARLAGLAAWMTVAGELEPGGRVTYTIRLVNDGLLPRGGSTRDGGGGQLRLQLPSGLQPLSAAASSGLATVEVDEATARWRGTVPAAGTVTLRVQAEVAPDAAGRTVAAQAVWLWGGDGEVLATDDPATPAAADPTRFVAGEQP